MRLREAGGHTLVLALESWHCCLLLHKISPVDHGQLVGLVQPQLKAQHEVLQLAAGCLPLHPPLAIALSNKVRSSSIILDTVRWSSECNDSDGDVLWQLAAGSHTIHPTFAVIHHLLCQAAGAGQQ